MEDKDVESTEKQSQKKLEKVFQNDDVKVVIAIIVITLIAIIVVTIKSVLNLEEESVNNSTFMPLKQQKMSKMKITGNGFIPCQGYSSFILLHNYW